MQVFISHSHADRRFVRSLARILKQQGIKAWVDEAEMRPGDSLTERIGDAIDKVDIVLAVLSPASVRSHWVRKELEIALDNEIARKRVTVIPILRKNCRLPTFLRGKFYADFSLPYRRKRNMPKFIESIRHHAAAPARRRKRSGRNRLRESDIRVRLKGLSDSERTLLKLTATDRTTPHIAKQLEISQDELRSRQNRLAARLGLSGRIELREQARGLDL